MSTAENGADDANGDEANQGTDAESVPNVDANIARLKALAVRAGKGDLDALVELRRVLDENPLIWRRLGDVAQLVESTFIVQLCGRDRLTAESIRRKVTALRESLLGDKPSALERLLVDEVVTAWLALRHAQLKAAETPHDDALAMARFHEKRLASARKQFQQAVRNLELLRGTRKGRRPASKSTAEYLSKTPTTKSPTADPPAAAAESKDGAEGDADHSGEDGYASEEFHWVSSTPLDDVELCPKAPPVVDSAP